MRYPAGERVRRGEDGVQQGPARRALLRIAALAGLAALGACNLDPPPPPSLVFAGLPVSGDWPVARRTGFTSCIELDAIHLRCRRHGVMLFGQGPYEGAVDLSGSNGKSGFNQLTLWSDTDQDGVYQVIVALARRGWHYCYTETRNGGDQAIFTRAGAPVRMSMDISYWGKRRLRILPPWNRHGLDRPCTPDSGLGRFGINLSETNRSETPPSRR